MVECEFINYYNFFYGTCVLIDTWWNVNDESVRKAVAKQGVLIDTWWNVNSFNMQNIGARLYVLIDTWWNVNDCVLNVVNNYFEF